MTNVAEPLVTVCIATYNQAAYIEACVLSALAQAGDLEVEIFVGDDNSTDDTPRILDRLEQRFPGRLQRVSRPHNLGGTRNYQELVARANGKFIAHLDGDDAWLPGKLRAQVDFMRAHPECPAVYTNAIALDTGGRVLGPFTVGHPATMSLGYLATRGNFLMHSSILYRAANRDVFLEPSGPVLDYAIHLGMAIRGPLGFVDLHLATYTVGTSTSTVRNAYPMVERLIWSSLESTASRLSASERRSCASHFAADAFIGRLLAKTSATPVGIAELAGFAGVSRLRLVLHALWAGIPIVARAGLRKVLRRAALMGALAEHPRA